MTPEQIPLAVLIDFTLVFVRIFTPEDFAVANQEPGALETPLLYTGKTWEYVFKWKPPDQNSRATAVHSGWELGERT